MSQFLGFGNGGDGAATLSGTQAPIDSACTGTAAATALTATNASFIANQMILIMQAQGASAGIWEINYIGSYVAGTITTQIPLANTYATGAFVQVIPQYNSLTISATLTAKAWNGTVGGVAAFAVNGVTNITGTLSASQTGFRGGRQNHTNGTAEQGEGTPGLGSASFAANGNGGGGNGDFNADAAGGGGNGQAGANGGGAPGGTGGVAAGATDLTTMVFGGGGGMAWDNTSFAPVPGSGGGIVLLFSNVLKGSGSIVSIGGNGGNSPSFGIGSGGSAGGSIFVKAQRIESGLTLTATGGSGAGTIRVSGGGAVGRIRIEACSSTSTSSPSASESIGGYTFCAAPGGFF